MTTATKLSPETISTVKATSPVLAKYGQTIINHFYEKMQHEEPSLAALFSDGAFKNGFQANNLAAAILAYSRNIDRLAELEGAIERITAAHIRAGVKPEHYPVVGRMLLQSIKEVLGDAATDEIMIAWKHAYAFLAETLIQLENK